MITTGENRVKTSDLRAQDGLMESTVLLIPPVLFRKHTTASLVHLYRDNSPSGMFADRAVV